MVKISLILTNESFDASTTRNYVLTMFQTNNQPTSRRFLRQEALREFFVFAHLICRQPWSRYMTYRLGTRVIATFSKSFFITLCHAFNCYLNKTELSYRELEFAAKTNFTERQKIPCWLFLEAYPFWPSFEGRWFWRSDYGVIASDILVVFFRQFCPNFILLWEQIIILMTDKREKKQRPFQQFGFARLSYFLWVNFFG